VFVWFVGTAMAAAWLVFRDPRFPFVPLAIGALVPDVVDIALGRIGPLHSAVVLFAAMVVVMLATIGRRPLRRVLLAGTMGALLHLVFDGAFAETEAFWWPLLGSPPEGTRVPSLERALALNLGLEAVGVALVVAVRRAARRG
jgi:hypothetical protein